MMKGKKGIKREENESKKENWAISIVWLRHFNHVFLYNHRHSDHFSFVIYLISQVDYIPKCFPKDERKTPAPSPEHS